MKEQIFESVDDLTVNFSTLSKSGCVKKQRNQQVSAKPSLRWQKIHIRKVAFLCIYSVLQNSTTSYYIRNTYVVTYFSTSRHLKSTACRSLILFQNNCPNSEVFIMVYRTIIAPLDTAQSLLNVASISLFSVFFQGIIHQMPLKTRNRRNILHTLHRI